MNFVKSLLIVLLLCGTVSHARADEASKRAKIDQMLDAMHADQIISQMMGQMSKIVDAQVQQMHLPDNARPAIDEMEKRLTALMTEELRWDKIRPIYVKVYDENFTEEEIGGIITFYQSPAGQALLSKMPQVLQRSTELMQATMVDLMPKVSAIVQDVVKKYGQH